MALPQRIRLPEAGIVLGAVVCLVGTFCPLYQEALLEFPKVQVAALGMYVL